MNTLNILNKEFLNDTLNNISYKIYFNNNVSCSIDALIEKYQKSSDSYSLTYIRELLSKRNKEKQCIKNLINRLRKYDFLLSMEIHHYKYQYLSTLPVDSFISGLETLRTFLSERLEFLCGSLKKAKSDINETHKILLELKKKVMLKPSVESVSDTGVLKEVYEVSKENPAYVDIEDTNKKVDFFELCDNIKGIQKAINGLSKRLMKLEIFMRYMKKSGKV